MEILNVETPTHGRVLLRAASAPRAVLLGFHGYTEHAEIQMARMDSLPGADAWTLISVQGLHRFYRGRSEEVVASWMTRQDRELMIADNIEYVSRAIERLAPADVPVFTTGFSQGVATAFRGGVRARRRALGIIAVGGDVPPELFEDEGVRFPRVLLMRGDADEWYTAEKLRKDVDALVARDVAVETLTYAGGHEWTPEVSAALAAFVGDALAGDTAP
ncbi:MAG TPA: hypothetical protein VM364_12355 [Vicinamibacterales bacterium]|nr:hypothetical protein [Vicinamibacterales bacterium]